MALRRRVSIETKTNHERWLVSYSDFITLLFAFFVVMYSVSQVNENKYRVLSETFQSTFAQAGAKQKNREERNKIASLERLETDLSEVLGGLINQGSLAVWGNEDWVEIEINANMLFQSASAEPSAQAKKVFADVADVLIPFENAIAVSGHTDNVPIRNDNFSSNWELSAARAVAVVNLLAYEGVDPTRLSAVGYGEYQPIADNASEEGRAKNRRVVLRVARGKAEAPRELAENVMEESGVEATGLSFESVTEEVSEGTSTEENSPEPTNAAPSDNVIEPIKLPNGGLLFTSDPKGRG